MRVSVVTDVKKNIFTKKKEMFQKIILVGVSACQIVMVGSVYCHRRFRPLFFLAIFNGFVVNVKTVKYCLFLFIVVFLRSSCVMPI